MTTKFSCRSLRDGIALCVFLCADICHYDEHRCVKQLSPGIYVIVRSCA